MVMIINPANAQAITTFKANAKGSGTSTSPNGGIQGGSIVNNAAGTKPATSSAAAAAKATKAAAAAKAGTAGAKAAASAAAKKGN